MKSNHVNLFSFPQQSALDSFIITERTLATNKDGVVSFLLFFRAWSHRQHFSFIWFIINIIFNFVALQRPTCNAVVKNHCGVVRRVLASEGSWKSYGGSTAPPTSHLIPPFICNQSKHLHSFFFFVLKKEINDVKSNHLKFTTQKESTNEPFRFHFADRWQLHFPVTMINFFVFRLFRASVTILTLSFMLHLEFPYEMIIARWG